MLLMTYVKYIEMKKMKNNLASSFRDPSGFLFVHNEELYRQINTNYKKNFEYLINSGLYENLTKNNLLIKHEEIDLDIEKSEDFYKYIKPEKIPFISYPYEWSFSAYKQAALLTLKIQKTALSCDMTLKDASAYNIQFIGYKPIFIDTLSFENYKENAPWIAYRQFCEHFLAPLLIMTYKDQRLINLLISNINGLPLDLVVKILPLKTFLNFSIFTHIYLNSLSKNIPNKNISAKETRLKLSKKQLISIIIDLENLIQNLKPKVCNTIWGNYYENTNYNPEAFNHKKQIVNEFINIINPQTFIDLGANTGQFSRSASNVKAYTISIDMDSLAIEKNCQKALEDKDENILPLIIDFANPSPSIGWKCKERENIFDRLGSNQNVMALALIHHLRISNNISINNLAEFFSALSKYLIIEFIPKSDSMVEKLLQNRDDVFSDYTKENFENEFCKYFEIEKYYKIENSERFIYLMKKKNF